VTPLARSSWSRFFEEFRCRGCGSQEAYRSRPRGFFEKHVLPLFGLQAVRCERCYHRSWAWSQIQVLERSQADRKQSQSEQAAGSKSTDRVA
jgi:hypothetical protein